MKFGTMTVIGAYPLKGFWWTWSTISEAQLFDSGYLAHFLSEGKKFGTVIGVWPMDIYSPNFVNFVRFRVIKIKINILAYV